MGTQISREETLFTSLQWAQLLEESFQIEMEEQEMRLCENEDDDNSGSKKKNMFHLSFVEWQALLGSLEEEDKMNSSNEANAAMKSQNVVSSGPTELCSQRLNRDNVNEPLVVAAVHAIAWVREVFRRNINEKDSSHSQKIAVSSSHELFYKSIDPNQDVIFADKMEALQDLVNNVRWHSASSTSEEEDSDEIEEDVHARTDHTRKKEDESDNDILVSDEHYKNTKQIENAEVKPLGKRQKLWRASVSLKNKVVRRGKKNMNDNNRTNEPMRLEKLSCFTDILQLFEITLEARKNTSESKDNTAVSKTYIKHLALILKKLDGNANIARNEIAYRSVSQHPVLVVCTGVLLLVTCVQFPSSAFAEIGLNILDDYLMKNIESWGREGEDGGGASNNNHNSGKRRTEITGNGKKLWPLLQFLSRRLMYKLYDKDAEVEAQASEGSGSYQEKLIKIYEERIRIPDASKNFECGDEEQYKEAIWNYERHQYVGQTYAWNLVQSNYLNANIFERDKAHVFLFFGPSGYGKSELAKRIATTLHGFPLFCKADDKHGTAEGGSEMKVPYDVEENGKLLYIHMPSFCTRDSIYSLVDPPAAHVGDGLLLSALMKEKDAVIVLDEFEKSTADSIQNLWLSAFQKNGTLRSLKKKERYASTTQTTFILTCNLCDGFIQKSKDAFLSPKTSEAKRMEMIQSYITKCKERCVELFGEPFVNRVDHFIPFVPYNEAEKREFICLQLEKLLSYQRIEKQKVIYITHRFVDSLVQSLESFHASTIEEILKPLIVFMSKEKWKSAVLTAEQTSGLLLSESNTDENISLGFFCDKKLNKSSNRVTRFRIIPAYRKEVETQNDTSATISVRKMSIFCWDDCPNGAACLAQWAREITPNTDIGTALANVEPLNDGIERKQEEEKATVVSGGIEGKTNDGSVFAGAQSNEKELQLEKKMMLDTEKELSLQKELLQLKDLLLQKDKEIELLKEKVMYLEMLVSLLVCMVMSCLFVLAMLVGLKVALLLFGVFFFLVTYLFKVPLGVLINALFSFFKFIGPVKGAIVVGILSVWIYMGVSHRLTCP